MPQVTPVTLLRYSLTYLLLARRAFFFNSPKSGTISIYCAGLLWWRWLNWRYFSHCWLLRLRNQWRHHRGLCPSCKSLYRRHHFILLCSTSFSPFTVSFCKPTMTNFFGAHDSSWRALSPTVIRTACFRPGSRRIAVTIVLRLPPWLCVGSCMTSFLRSTEDNSTHFSRPARLELSFWVKTNFSVPQGCILDPI